jgi:LysR family transcriptional regulator, nitrogen assimilation regulatory protein
MDLRQLRYILAIAEHGSILKASQALRVAQPSLSTHLKNLEEELGIVLFDRTARGVVATSEGQELIRHARLILKLADDARESLRSRSASPVGQVTFAIPTSLVEILAVPLIEKTQASLPNVKLRIVESMSGFISQWLLEGQIDVGLLYGVQSSSGIDSTKLLTEELYLAGRDDSSLHDIIKNGEVAFHHLETLKLVLPGREHGLRSLIEQSARRVGINLNVVIEIDAFNQIKRLVRRGAGYTILSLAALQNDEVGSVLSVARIVEPVVERSVYIAHATNRPLTRAAHEVKHIAVNILQTEAHSGWWRARL